MKYGARVLATLGCAAILLGFLAFAIPDRIMNDLPPAERARTDRSVVEMEWVNRGLHSLEAGGLLLVVAVILYLSDKVGTRGGRSAG
jgi:hypothetical protein